jgi:hypothetical protein
MIPYIILYSATFHAPAHSSHQSESRYFTSETNNLKRLGNSRTSRTEPPALEPGPDTPPVRPLSRLGPHQGPRQPRPGRARRPSVPSAGPGRSPTVPTLKPACRPAPTGADAPSARPRRPADDSDRPWRAEASLTGRAVRRRGSRARPRSRGSTPRRPADLRKKAQIHCKMPAQTPHPLSKA